MYEYRCSNEFCNESWSINEGDISAMYLTCPYCNKGRGIFVKQIKNEEIHEDIKNLAVKKPDEQYSVSRDEVIEELPSEPQKEKKSQTKKANKTIEKQDIVPQKEDKVSQKGKKASKKEDGSETNKNKKKNVENQLAMTDVKEETKKEINEDDIFERIKRKRQQEEDFCKECGEDTDVLEISADSMEEIEKRIKEFEEYYYIKVLDRNVQQQGKRFNCMIKYCRK